MDETGVMDKSLATDAFRKRANQIVPIKPLIQQLSDSEPRSLGAFIEAKREEVGISQRQLCRALGVKRRSIQRIIEGEAQKVDGLILTKLAVFFQHDLHDLIQIYLASASSDERNEVKRAKRAGFIVRQFDLPGLRKIGLTDTAADLDHIEQRVKEFFGYDSIYEYAEELPLALFSESAFDSSRKMQRLWMSAVHHQFESLVEDAYEFDEKRLERIVTEMRSYTVDVQSGFSDFVRKLFRCGVIVIVESYVMNSAVYGGTMIVGGRPCIVLTNRDKRYDRLWRTLAHELCHVLVHRKKIARQGYHVTGEPSLFNEEIEKEADQFAAEILVPKKNRDQVRPHIDIEAAVRRYAAKWHVHPSLIYGLYLDEDLKNAPEDFRSREYSKYRANHLIRPDEALRSFRNLDISTWTRETLDETVPLLKEALQPKAV